MEKIQANAVIEILGRPKEYIYDSLKNLIKVKIANEKGIKVIEQDVHEPVLAKDSKDLFTTFAEITLDFDSLDVYLNFMFAYMPSHLDIAYPEELVLKNEDLNLLGNRLSQRLHDYDAIVKNALMENEILKKKLMEVAPHLFNQQTPKISEVNPPKTKARKAKPKKKK